MESRHRAGGVRRSSRGPWMGLLSAVMVLAGALALGGATAYADDRPPGGNFSNPVVRAVDIAEPAIVRIATLYTAHISINDVCGQNIALPASGDYTAGGTGSGAFISSSGDILTADHVVDIPKSDLDTELLGDPQSPAAQDAADAVNQACRPTTPITAADIANGILQANGFDPRVVYSPPQRLVWQATSYTGPTAGGTPKSFLDGLLSAQHESATVTASSTFDQNDLAILHVALTDTPSIQLDNSSSVAVQDQLTIVGFPGNGDVSTSATDLFTPSVNIINVSAIKDGDNGAKLIQVGGNVEHGDSGGPALDAAGHIVGVVSFGGPDAGSTAFLRSSNDALSLISSAGINVQPGAFQQLWEQAFSDYSSTSAGHWHKAARELDALASQYPAFKGAQPYKDYADQAAQTEKVPVDSFAVTAIVGVVAVVVLLIVGGMVLLLVLRGRRKKAPQLAGVGPGVQGIYYPSGTPYGYSPGGYGTQGGYGGYGGYGPPSSYGGYGGQSAGYAPPAAPAGYNWQSSALPPVTSPGNLGPADQTGGGIPGRVPVPGHAYPAPANFPPSYTPASPPQTPAPVYSTPTSAQDRIGPSGWSPQATPSPGPAGGQATCVNGHAMASYEVYCALCGAPRSTSFPPAPSDS